MNAHRRAVFKPLFILIAVLAIVTAATWGRPYWLDNSIFVAIFALMALSVGLSYGQAGILSIATGAFASIGAFGTGIVTTRFGLSPYVGLIVAIIIPPLLAWPIARTVLRLSPLPLSIATILISQVLEIAVREGGDFTGGYIGLSGIPRLSIAASAQSMHFLAWGCVIVALVLYINLMDSALGRAVRTARHDALRATADGVGVTNLLSSTFALSASLAGVAGWLYAHHLTYMGPDSLTTHVSIQALLMAVVGGAHTFLGPIIGAALLLLVTLFLPAAETQGMFFGAMLVFVLVVAPRGIVGWRWFGKLRSIDGH
jgi:branched-chain amino acid transport system permease protein